MKLANVTNDRLDGSVPEPQHGRSSAAVQRLEGHGWRVIGRSAHLDKLIRPFLGRRAARRLAPHPAARKAGPLWLCPCSNRSPIEKGHSSGFKEKMRIGYARVSTQEQETRAQLDAFAKAGVELVHEEKRSGATLRRPVLDKLLRNLKRGDTLVVYKLDRIARSNICSASSNVCRIRSLKHRDKLRSKEIKHEVREQPTNHRPDHERQSNIQSRDKNRKHKDSLLSKNDKDRRNREPDLKRNGYL